MIIRFSQNDRILDLNHSNTRDHSKSRFTTNKGEHT
jgi:hypothetical protein